VSIIFGTNIASEIYCLQTLSTLNLLIHFQRPDEVSA